MNLIISSDLSAPPSEISCFRDITLYAKCFLFEDVLLKCPKGTRSLYWNWLKAHGAHDFISYLIRDNEIESGLLISQRNGNLNIDRINSFNIDFVISFLRSSSYR